METEVKTVANPTAGNAKLYFKGLVSELSEKKTNGYGVAMYDHKDKLLFQMKGLLQETEITSLEAELMALKLGLNQAHAFGIRHIFIYTDCYPLHRDLSERDTLAQPKIAMLMDDVQRIKNQFESTKVFLVSRNDIKFAYDLANAAMVSEISKPMNPPCTQEAAMKKVCFICFDDFNSNQMFFITGCGHRFCRECMTRHIEAKLSEGLVLNCSCPFCKTKLTLKSCESLLPPKLRAIWDERIRENSIPSTQRVYCPYPKCSALMSKTDISKAGLKRNCISCGEPFCINCKVPWHNDLLCDVYKRLHPNPDDAKLQDLANQRMWRQCNSCGHMISVYSGCSAVACRCGHIFCYFCGVELREEHAVCPNHQFMIINGDAPPVAFAKWFCYCCGFLVIIVFALWLFIGFYNHYF